MNEGTGLQRSEVIRAAMAAGGPGAHFDPVQMQKLLFLVDREIPQLVDGPHFQFRPYLYGPFDETVYDELDKLEEAGSVQIDQNRQYRRYGLTRLGDDEGEQCLGRLQEAAVRYLVEAARWVRTVTFKQLVLAIYRRYPDMATNTVISGLAPSRGRLLSTLPVPSFLRGMGRALDITGTLDAYPWIRDTSNLGAPALAEDWQAVGDDLAVAVARTHLSLNGR